MTLKWNRNHVLHSASCWEKYWPKLHHCLVLRIRKLALWDHEQSIHTLNNAAGAVFWSLQLWIIPSTLYFSAGVLMSPCLKSFFFLFVCVIELSGIYVFFYICPYLSASVSLFFCVCVCHVTVLLFAFRRPASGLWVVFSSLLLVRTNWGCDAVKRGYNFQRRNQD